MIHRQKRRRKNVDGQHVKIINAEGDVTLNKKTPTGTKG
jgi:hypothetical protein